MDSIFDFDDDKGESGEDDRAESKRKSDSEFDTVSTHPLDDLEDTLAEVLERRLRSNSLLREQMAQSIQIGSTSFGPPKTKRAEPAVLRVRVWLEPSRLRDVECVRNIASYDGSEEFWMPVRRAVAAYIGLRGSATDERRSTLYQLGSAIAAWRGHQAGMAFRGFLDRKKEAALGQFELLVKGDQQELSAKSDFDELAPAPRQARSVKPEKDLPSRGTGSFQDALSHTPKDADLGLTRSVMPYAVREIRNQENCRATVASDGVLRTWDGEHVIDTDGETCRYVLAGGASGPVLYVSQTFTEAYSGALDTYPTLMAHSQITAEPVIGAGDISVSAGKVTSISCKSGNFQPRGSNFARTLKFFVRLGLVSERHIVTGRVSVEQFISKAQGYDVDNGVIVKLMGDIMEGKLIGKS